MFMSVTRSLSVVPFVAPATIFSNKKRIYQLRLSRVRPPKSERSIVRDIVPMFELTLDGLEKKVRYLCAR